MEDRLNDAIKYPDSGHWGHEVGSDIEEVKNCIQSGAIVSTQHVLLLLDMIEDNISASEYQFPIEVAQLLLNKSAVSQSALQELSVALTKCCEMDSQRNAIGFIEMMIKKD